MDSTLTSRPPRPSSRVNASHPERRPVTLLQTLSGDKDIYVCSKQKTGQQTVSYTSDECVCEDKLHWNVQF